MKLESVIRLLKEEKHPAYDWLSARAEEGKSTVDEVAAAIFMKAVHYYMDEGFVFKVFKVKLHPDLLGLRLSKPIEVLEDKLLDPIVGDLIVSKG